jgi:hypothetical protein
MPIDPNIALNVRPPEPTNMLGQMAQVMAIRQAQQEYEGSAGVNELARKGERDPYAYLQHGKQGQAAAASITKIQKEKLESDEKRSVMLGGLAGPVMENPTPTTFNFALDRAVNYGLMTPTQKQEVMAQYGGSPETIKGYAAQIFKGSISAQAQQSDATSRANNAATVGATIRGQDLTNARAMEGTWSNVIVGRRVMQQNSRTGEVREVQDPTPDVGGTVTVGPITNLPDTFTGGGVVTNGGGGAPVSAKPNMLPETVNATPSVNGLRNPPVVATAPVSKIRPPVTNPLMVEEKPVWNEKAGVWMIPPTTENPQGKVVDTPEVKRIVQTRAANETLKIAGFNPKTGSDEISELIKQSTSGLGQNWGSKAWGAITGTGTSGAKAIAALETRANELTLGLAPNGSLGAGFSNEDRDFMLKKLGDVANPNAPMNVRLAAWEDVMERAARTAGVPYPKSAKNTGDITIDPALAEALKRYPVKK